MFINSKIDLDYLDSLPLRESTTTYLKHDSTAYCDYKESKLIHFNLSYRKYEKRLQRACTKFIGQPVNNLVSYLLGIKTKNKFYKQAIEFVYNCLYNINSYSNTLDYVKVIDGIVVSKVKLNHKSRWKKQKEDTKPYKPDYSLLDGRKLVYRHNCYFYLIEDNDYYSMDYKSNTVFIPSVYLQLNKHELKHFKISNN